MCCFDGMKPDPDWILDPKISALVRRKARELTGTPGFSRSDQPDIEQDLKLLLVRKTELFDRCRAQTVTFASRLIENKAKSMLRAVRAKKRDCRKDVSLDAEIPDGNGKLTSHLETLDEAAGRRHTGQRQRDTHEARSLKLDLAATNETLPKPLQDVAALMSHVSQFATAEVLGISRRQLATRVQALREAYETRGLIA